MFNLFITSLAIGSGTGVPVTTDYPQIVMQMTVFSGDPLGSKASGNVSVLTNTTLSVVDRQTVTVRAGQSDKSLVKPSEFTPNEIGVFAELTPTMEAERSVRLQVKIKIVDGDTLIKQTTGVETATVLKEGKIHRMRIGAKSAWDQKWAELSVKIINSKEEREAYLLSETKPKHGQFLIN